MKNKKAIMKKTIMLAMRALPVLFLLFMIFGFDEPYIANLTLLSAGIHELGHIFAIYKITGKYSMKSNFSGFRLSAERHLSYNEELIIALCGPMANLFVFILLLPFFKFGDESYIATFGILNLFTALSNLLPIESYDGYRIAECLILKFSHGNMLLFVLHKISFFFLVTFSFISLYLIKTFDGGYWIFFIFVTILIKNIKNDKNAFFERKQEKKRDFERF